MSYEIVNSEILTAEDEAARPVIKRSMFICRLIRLPVFRKDEISMPNCRGYEVKTNDLLTAGEKALAADPVTRRNRFICVIQLNHDNL